MISGEDQVLIQRLAIFLAENPIGLLWQIDRIYRIFACLNSPVGQDLLRKQNRFCDTVIRKAGQLTEQLEVKLNLHGDEITPELIHSAQEMRSQIRQVVSQL